MFIGDLRLPGRDDEEGVAFYAPNEWLGARGAWLVLLLGHTDPNDPVSGPDPNVPLKDKGLTLRPCGGVLFRTFRNRLQDHRAPFSDSLKEVQEDGDVGLFRMIHRHLKGKRVPINLLHCCFDVSWSLRCQLILGGRWNSYRLGFPNPIWRVPFACL